MTLRILGIFLSVCDTVRQLREAVAADMLINVKLVCMIVLFVSLIVNYLYQLIKHWFIHGMVSLLREFFVSNRVHFIL